MISVGGSGVTVNVRNVVLEGLGASGAFLSGIYYDDGAQGKIENTQIRGFYSAGIQAFESHVVIRRNIVQDNGSVGIQVTNGVYEIVHNNVSNHASYGIELEGELSDTRAMSNQLQGNGNGLWVGGSSANVSRNDLLQSQIRGIVAAAGSAQNTFTMNVVLGVGTGQPSCEDLGVGNQWLRNSSDTPSSPPEICPVP